MSDIQKNVSPGRPKGCLNYPPEFKQRLIEVQSGSLKTVATGHWCLTSNKLIIRKLSSSCVMAGKYGNRSQFRLS